MQTTAPPGAVFERLADTVGWKTWSPMVDAEIVEPAAGDHPEGVGLVRRFLAPRRKTWTVERVVRFEPGRRYAYEMLSGLPLRGYVADITLAPVDSGTAITWQSTFEARVPGTGWFYRLVLRRFIADLVGRLAATSADHHDAR